MKQFSVKSGLSLLVTGALIAATAGMSRAADTTAPTTPGTGTTGTTQPAPKKRHKANTVAVRGTVVSATATSLVIKLGKKAGGGEKTFSVPDTAKVTSNRLPIKLDTLTAGQKVTVTTLEDGTTVTHVSLQQPKAPKTPATTAPAPGTPAK